VLVRRSLAIAALVFASGVAAGLLSRNLHVGGAASSKTTAFPVVDARILVLFNARRKSHGLRALRLDLVLASLAAIHSRDQIRGDYFAHDEPHGQTFAERLAYLHRREVGEVIAWGTGGFSTAAGFVSLWMASPEHRRIILRPSLRRVGISVRQGGPYQGQSSARVATADFST
jgi:uncharacterized protein YkwD